MNLTINLDELMSDDQTAIERLEYDQEDGSDEERFGWQIYPCQQSIVWPWRDLDAKTDRVKANTEIEVSDLNEDDMTLNLEQLRVRLYWQGDAPTSPLSLKDLYMTLHSNAVDWA